MREDYRSQDDQALSLAGALAPAEPMAVNILMVDDEPRNLTVLETILNDPGYRLVPASSPDNALLALVQEEFALLILDVQMPGMTGFELAQIIKGRKKTAQIPIIFLTAHFNSDEHVLEGYGTGAVDYLQKPVNAAALRSKVAVFAELHRRGRELAVANRALTAEVVERTRAEDELRRWNAHLDSRVAERTRELDASNARLRLATEAMGLGFWLWNLDTDRWSWENDWPTAVLKVDPAEWPGSSAELMQWLEPEEAERFAAAAAAAAAASSGTRLLFEGRVLHAHHADLVLEFDGRLVGSVGEPRTILGTVRDVSERHRAVEELRRSEEELRDADRHKDEFLATLAHELRNPLAPVRNAVGILQHSGFANVQTSRAGEIIERQVKVLARLIDDLMDVARINQRRLELQLDSVCLQDVIELAIEGSRPQIDELHHKLEVVLPETPILLIADATRLAQVFTNILTNAAKYTERGGHIVLQAVVADSNARITVQDNGIGISPENLDRVFEMFSQVEIALARSRGGLGIGLSLAKRLVELHGGRVIARSGGLGQGSEFEVQLPLSQAVSARQGVAEEAVRRPSGERVLVVDDNRDGAETLAALLSIYGYEVALAFDGEQALTEAETHKPEIVLLDIGLPKLNGYEVCRAIKAMPWAVETRIVAITGWGDVNSRQAALEAGFDRHFVKPVTESQVLAAINELLADAAVSSRGERLPPSSL